MRKGNTVIYSEKHYAWLVSAMHPAIINKKHKIQQRTEIEGVVIDVEDHNINSMITVTWNNHRTNVHFEDNLEVID